MRPMTLRLICKHAYPKPQYPDELEESEEDSDNYDKEAVVIEQTSKVEDAIETSKELFIAKSCKVELDWQKPNPRPIIQRKVGVGLAALVAMKQ